MVIPWDALLYPILKQIMDYFSCSILNSAFQFYKKRLPEVASYAEMLHNMRPSLYHNDDIT